MTSDNYFIPSSSNSTQSQQTQHDVKMYYYYSYVFDAWKNIVESSSLLKSASSPRATKSHNSLLMVSLLRILAVCVLLLCEVRGFIFPQVMRHEAGSQWSRRSESCSYGNCGSSSCLSFRGIPRLSARVTYESSPPIATVSLFPSKVVDRMCMFSPYRPCYSHSSSFSPSLPLSSPHMSSHLLTFHLFFSPLILSSSTLSSRPRSFPSRAYY